MSDRVTWGEGAYAGFWLRFAGLLIDWLLIGTLTVALVVVLMVVLGVSFAVGAAGPELAAGQGGVMVLLFWLVWIAPYFLYDTLMTSKLGWTVGKRAVGVEVRRADGELISFGQAAGRYLGRIVSSIPLFLGFLWAAWDPRKQTWHDKFVNCFVVQPAQVAPAGLPGTAQVARPWGGYSGWGIPTAPRPEPGSFGEEGANGFGWQGSPATPGEVGSAAAAEPEPPVAERPVAEPSEAGREEPAARDEPAAGTGAPGTTDWGRELDWSAEPEPQPRPAVEGDSLEFARWAGSEPPDAGVPDGGAPDAGPPGEPGSPGSGGPQPADAPADRQDPGAQTPAPDVQTAEPGTPFAPGSAWPGGAGEAAPSPEPELAPPPRADDPNVVGVSRAGVPSESAAWLEQVADQVDTRLDRVTAQWRSSPQAEAARACAFGLLLGHLATIYPHMAEDLASVAEAHPSFSTLTAGNRLATLQQIVADPRRAAAWLGPLIGEQDPAQVQRLLD